MEAINIPRMAKDPTVEPPANAVVSLGGSRMTIKAAADLLGEWEAEYSEISDTASDGERCRGARAQATAYAKVRKILRRPGFKVPEGEVFDADAEVEAARAEIDRGKARAEEADESEETAADEEE